jgi:peptidoglycan/LPS O-acetylase OafA/YrhL
MTGSLKYRPDIDGLRAIAVTSVVLFHAGLPFVGGGFVGVDVFFVISGYLITTIIHRESRDGRFTVLAFYERRIRRIFPALFAMLLIVSLVSTFLLMPTDYKEYGESVTATALFSSNFFFWHKSGYFDAAAELKPLLHTWSLAVEEQYYVVFPVLMALLIRHVSKWRLLLSLLALSSFIYAIFEVNHNISLAFYSPLSRAWELLIGAMVAVDVVPSIKRQGVRECVAVLGVVLIFIAIFGYSADTKFPGLAALPPCLGATLLIYANNGHPTFVGRALSVKPMIWCGLISFSLYLWHWPLLVFVKYVLMRPLRLEEMLLLLLASFALGWLSWRFVERPFRHSRAGRARLFTGAAIIMGSAMVFGAAVYALNGAPTRLPASVRHFAAAAADVNPDRATCDRQSLSRIKSGQVCVLGNMKAPHPTFALLGDSFGDALMPAVEQAAMLHGQKGLMLTYSGCIPLVGLDQGNPACREFFTAVLDEIKRRPSITRVILVGRWSSIVLGTRFGSFSQDLFVTDASSPGKSFAENANAFSRSMARTARAFSPRKLYVVAYLPEQAVDVPRAAALRRWFGPVPEFGVARNIYDQRQALVHKILEPQSHAYGYTILDGGSMLCGSQKCPAIRGTDVLYADDNHVSRTGALATASIFAPVFSR